MRIMRIMLAIVALLWVGVSAAENARTLALPQPLIESDFVPFSPARAELGRLLFYDPILSGNRNISCATCHHHDHGTGDGLSLPVGEGGVGLSQKRTVGEGAQRIRRRVPRNAPPLFNLGAKEIRQLFHDGRLFFDANEPSGFRSPAGEYMPNGLKTITAAQAMFPVTAETEMAGDLEENAVAVARDKIADGGFREVWAALEAQVRTVEAYRPLFQAAYGDETIDMVRIANALGDFINSEWRADDSPFDRHLRGDEQALNPQQKDGMTLFYGKAGCATCHSGTLMTDHDFHAIAMPPLGGRATRSFDPIIRDRGRINFTDRIEDAWKFRTPSLRNVADTAPYGHSGAYPILDTVIRHHLDPVESLRNYDRRLAVLPEYGDHNDFAALDNERVVDAIAAANELKPAALNDNEIKALAAFLESLSDPAALEGRLGKPDFVPSGLPLDD